MARQSRVEITSITPQAPDDKEVYVMLPLKLEVECWYHQLGEFFSRLESSKEFIKVDGLDLKVKEDEEGRMVATISLIVSTFYLKD